MRYCVTGAAGFIGSNLVERLLDDGHEVVGVDNFSTGLRRNVEDWLEDGSFAFMEGDLCDMEVCKRAVEGADFVLHEAAFGSVPRSVEDPAAYVYNNAMSTINILLASRDAGVKRFVHASSASVYGDVSEGVLNESLPADPYNPYAVSKLAAEWVVRVFWRSYGLPTVCLRYFNVFGPRQRPGGSYAAVVPAFIGAALEHRPVTIHWDGKQARDFTHVENIVRANLLACGAPGRANGDVFNVAAGGFTAVDELHRMVAEAAGDNTPPVHAPARAGDVRGCRSDIGKAMEVLGYRPKVDVEEGVRAVVKWYADNPDYFREVENARHI